MKTRKMQKGGSVRIVGHGLRHPWGRVGPSGRAGGRLAVAGALALSLILIPGTSSASGQARDEAPECRCVDPQGNEIENCTCLRMPRMEEVAPRLAFTLGGGPRLGISVRAGPISADDADGAVVDEVLDGGPADEAGLRAGDVITHVAGRSLSQPLSSDQERRIDLDRSVPAQRLRVLVRELEPGQEVEVRYLRDGESRSATVEVRELWDLRGAAPRGRWRWDQERFRDEMARFGERLGDIHVLRGPGSRLLVPGTGRAAGLELVELNPALGRYFGVEEGVLVTDVSPSSTLGLQSGDVVLEVGDRRVTTPDRLRRILASYGEDEEIRLRIVREGEERLLTAPSHE
ncbi:MAG: PDZ domain-containing protein [Longimicrobiales bacterium]|nr:PDZ domain-containing protein [Longimicrobiales bacterium]